MKNSVPIQFSPNVSPIIDAYTDHDSIKKWFENCRAYVHDSLLAQMQNDPNDNTASKAKSQLDICDKALFDTEASFEAIDMAEQNAKNISTNPQKGITINKFYNQELSQRLDEIKKIADSISTDVSIINSKLETKNNASMSLAMLMNDKTFQEIQEIEKQVIYRRFYFPGGEPKKVSVKDSRELRRWDPRTIDEYIALAKQQGFHRFFVYYNGFEFKPISFTQAETVLKSCVNWSLKRISEDGGCDKFEVCGIIAGLIYFDKVDSFFEEMNIGANQTMFERVCDIYSDTIDPMIEKIANVLTHQTQRNFKKNNYGWMAEDDALAFDSAKYVAKLITLKSQYEMYKERVWKILEGLNALEVCTNYTNITGNNLSIDQKMQCALSIEGKGQNVPTSNSSQPADSNESTANRSSTESIPSESSTQMNTSTAAPASPAAPAAPWQESNDQDSQESGIKGALKDKTLLYVVIAISVVLFGLLIFIIWRKATSPSKSKQTIPTNA